MHALECSLRFDQHIHNGDLLSARTTHIPSGRPPTGSAPFTWVQSAQDALIHDRLTQVTDWSLQSALYHWHRYNGINNAYKSNKIPTPYLWSGSTHYRKGKYVADGKFDPDAVSQQVGAAVLLRKLIDLNAVDLTGTALVSNALAATGAPHLLTINLPGQAFKYAKRELEYPGPLDIGAGSNGSSTTERALVRKVQEWLTLNDCDTGIDGDYGPSTATQLSRFRERNGQATTGPLDQDTWAVLTKSMLEAVSVTKFSKGTSLEDAIVTTAQRYIRSAPREVGGQNRGPWVRIYMAGREGDAQKWCAGFISVIVAQVARDLDIGIPFARRVGVDALVADAQKDERFILGASLNTSSLRTSHLKSGHLFVIRKSSSDWTHVGIVLRLNETTFDTFEGNTSGKGIVDGGVARLFNRSYTSKDFLRLQ